LDFFNLPAADLVKIHPLGDVVDSIELFYSLKGLLNVQALKAE
jgi:hypothetical protein